MSSLAKQIKALPKSSGIYFFKNNKGEVLYIGKAANLKNRIGSYFKGELARGAGIDQMLNEATKIDYQETESEIEALLLEAELIKQHQPKYNVRLKDDKSFNVIRISWEEEYPRILLVRQKNLAAELEKHKKSRFFGPYTSAGQLRQALRILRHIFPYCNTSMLERKRALKLNRPCLYYNLGLCPGTCINKIDKTNYRKTIRQLITFLEGGKQKVMTDLERQMKQAAKKKDYEQAAIWRDRFLALQHLAKTSRIRWRDELESDIQTTFRLPHRIEAYDVSNIFGNYAVGAMVVYLDGQPNQDDYRKFEIRTVKGINDIASLGEILRRRLNHPEWPYPDLMIVDGGKGQLNAAVRALFNKGLRIPVLAVAKGPSRKKLDLYWHGPKVLTGEKLIRQITGEAHRFAIKYYRLLHRKEFKQS